MASLAARFAGHWRITEHDEAIPSSPARDGRGQQIWSLDRAGVLSERYEARFANGAAADDTAVVWWDGVAHAYRGMFCALFQRRGCTPFDLVSDGATITMTGVFDAGESQLAWREVFTFADQDHFTQTLYQGAPGGELTLASTIMAAKSAP
jgi:hypothetical protein